jgi:putative oxidoreductase
MNTFFRKLVSTDSSSSQLVIRLTLALVMLPHGLQKTLGLFGGYGFFGTMGFFTEKLGMPGAVAFLVIMAESLGSIALGIGLLTRFCAASIALVMVGAISMGHFQNGFFMNWYGNQAGEGFEYHLLVIGMALALMLSGGGRASIDRALAKEQA